ncbi:MAG TPA: hypothetical protein VER55_16200, partial [Ardenticatenaceae bacterium]|nr:hypothetical protein [Ardenticatenaceae bacterium]
MIPERMLYEQINEAIHQPSGNRDAQVARLATRLYWAAQWRGQLGRLRSLVTGHKAELLDLATFKERYQMGARHAIGIQTVPIAEIRGSEGRSQDFDADFNPLNTRTAGRWLAIAQACYRYESLPPVALIRIGNSYFVRDGHHRLSVFRAMGQRY